MMNKKCEGIDCAWCMSVECPNEKERKMTNKEQIKIVCPLTCTPCDLTCIKYFESCSYKTKALIDIIDKVMRQK